MIKHERKRAYTKGRQKGGRTDGNVRKIGKQSNVVYRRRPLARWQSSLDVQLYHNRKTERQREGQK